MASTHTFTIVVSSPDNTLVTGTFAAQARALGEEAVRLCSNQLGTARAPSVATETITLTSAAVVKS